MAFDTLERSPPLFFRQGPSALTRLVFYGALALLMMAMDVRWHVAAPVRGVIGLAIAPAVEAARAPERAWESVSEHFESLGNAQRALAAQRAQNVALALQAQRAHEQAAENVHLRELLQLKQTAPVQSTAAEVVAEARDAYSRTLFIDKGAVAGIVVGSPVMDRHGLLGQVTAVAPLTASVRLITDRESAIPVEVERDGRRGVLVGSAGAATGNLEFLWQAANVDLRPGDLLVTSGLDGIYPRGLVVAKVASVQRPPDSAFAHVACTPVATVDSGRHVLVLAPRAALVHPPAAPPPRHRGAKR